MYGHSVYRAGHYSRPHILICTQADCYWSDTQTGPFRTSWTCDLQTWIHNLACNVIFISAAITKFFSLHVLLQIYPWVLDHFTGLTGVPAALQLICLPFNPESPKYLLLVQNQHQEANKGKNILKIYPANSLLNCDSYLCWLLVNCKILDHMHIYNKYLSS